MFLFLFSQRMWELSFSTLKGQKMGVLQCRSLESLMLGCCFLCQSIQHVKMSLSVHASHDVQNLYGENTGCCRIMSESVKSVKSQRTFSFYFSSFWKESLNSQNTAWEFTKYKILKAWIQTFDDLVCFL